MRAVLAGLLLLAAALATSGCLDPHRVVVDPGVLARTQLDWGEDRLPLDGGGWLGTKSLETRYRFSPDGSGPPYPAVLSVFSLRESRRSPTEDLLRQARDSVEAAAKEQHISLAAGPGRTGTRTLDSGVATTWFVREGTVTQRGPLFEEAVKVRIIGEVGHDGRSETSVVAIGLAQVDRQMQCPLLGPCQRAEDLRAWVEMVGDPRGSVAGAVSATGLLHHLETH